MATVAEVFKSMKDRFKADAAAGKDLVFQFDITDDEPYYIAINDGDLDISQGENDEAEVTLIADSSTFIDLMTGELDGMKAYMTGKLKTKGNMILATKLNDFFER